jgi:hypothetical protein
MELFETIAPTRKRRDENENRSETLVIADIVILLNDDMLYIRRDMNDNCGVRQMFETLAQIRRTIQMGSKRRERMTVFTSSFDVKMYFAPHFDRNEVRTILIERLHAQTG